MNTCIRDTYVQTPGGLVYKTDGRYITAPDRALSLREGKRLMLEHAIAELRKTLTAGDTIYGIVRTVAKSGMSRRIYFYKLTADGPLYLTGRFAALAGTDDFDGGLRVNGCGMDMIFATVDNVAHTLGMPLKHAQL